MFHPRCGARIRLSADHRTATRSPSEFNYGLVFSGEPLADEELFEIRIDKKTYSWIGSLEVGVTTCDPENLNFPASATDLRSGTWILSGKSVLKDGRTLMETYPLNLEKIVEGERIGVMRTSSGELEFFVNGISHGVAATDLPQRVFALVDVYGKVSQVSIMSKPGGGNGDECNSRASDLSIPELVSSDMSSSTTSNYRGGGGDDNNQQSLQQPLNNNLPHSPTTSGITPSNSVGSERLRFHERTGSLVKLSCNGRAAERMRPLDEFNNAVVMTHRPLVSDTMFEIRIDRLVKKWSGSIEVGVTTHDPSQLEFPATMTNMRSGTVMMSGCGILTNGKGTKREYGEYNLDELRVGDRIGMMRKSNGDLHYFINGLDQGVAASRVPESIWGVVDLYGMTVKVTIVDRDEREEQNLITRRNTVLRENVMQSLTDVSDDDSEDRLLFHPNCGSHAAVINNGRTAHRPNSLDDFNNAVVLTNRPLKLNEVFEVRIDKMVTKWAGSIEVGVTTHAPNELEYPSTMTNVRSGTWIMTGNSVMHNGTSVIDDYGQNLDRLQMGSRVGVVIREGGCLHFLVNGEDQGEAGVGLPPRLYAVIDLYGQATQASIVSHCPSCSPTAPLPPASSPFSSEIHFHSVHGRNARVTNGGKTASRPRSTVEFNDAIVITNRPLRPGEMFSVVVERIVDRWSGSIEAGVTAIRPDELELPGTMTDLDHDTWMLSGFAVMKDGVTLRHGYPLDLDNVGVGSVVGMKLLEGGSLHYYLDGVDQGEACSGLPEAVYPVVDLYGQCAQVSIVSSLEPVMEIDESTCHQLPSHSPSDTTVLPNHQHLLHKLHSVVGTAVTLDERLISAWRSCQVPCGGLVYGSAPLATGELFEVVLESHAGQWAGALAVGLASGPQPLDKSRVPLQITAVKEYVCYVAGSDVFQNGELIRRNYCPSLEWPRPPARIGIKRATDATLHLYLDGVDQGVAAHNIPKKVYPVIDMYGSTCGLRVVSKEGVPNIADAPTQPAHAELESLCDKNYVEGASSEGKKNNEDMEKSVEDGDLVSEIHDVDGYGDLHVFHELHGRNVQVSENRLAAKRVASYNQGLVLVNNHSSRRGHLFQICVESLNTRWVSSLSIGIASPSTLSSTLPVTALGLKKDAWIISGDCVYHNGYKVKSKYGPNLDTLGVGSLVGILVDEENNLKLFVNGVDHGVAATNVPKLWIPVLDLYGMCDQVSIVNPTPEPGASALSPTDAVNTTSSNILGLSNGGASSSSCVAPIRVRHDWAEAEKGDTERKEKQRESAESPGAPGVSSTNTTGGGGGGGVDAARTKSDKMNENIQCCGSINANSTVPPLHSPTNTTSGAHDAKALASTENLTLQMYEQQQNAERRAANEEKASSGSGSFLKSPTVAVRSIGSSLAVTPISPVNLVKPPACDYLSSVLRLKTSLGLPNGFFRKDGGVICYCPTCCSSGWRQQQHQQSGGKSGSGGSGGEVGPPPLGWARLPLRHRGGAATNKSVGGQPPSVAPAGPTGTTGAPPAATDQWHVAFVATSLGTIRRILDVGELMTPGELRLGQDLTGCAGRDKKHDESDSNLIVLWPTLQSATLASYSPKHQYIDPKTKQSMVAYAALQVLVRPGSYKVGEGSPRSPPAVQQQQQVTGLQPSTEPPSTTTLLVVGGGGGPDDGPQPTSAPTAVGVGTGASGDPAAPVAADSTIVEWVTKERNATVLTALLLRLEPI